MIHKTRWASIIFWVLLLALISCTDSQVGIAPEYNNIASNHSNIEKGLKSEGNVVNEELARFTAGYFANDVNFKYDYFLTGKMANREGPPKEIQNVLTLKDRNQQPAIYMINYKEKGFVIISGDKSVNPILAYSDENRLPKAEKEIPGGLDFWVSSTVADIADKRETENYADTDADIERGWKSILNLYHQDPELYVVEPPDDGCTPTSTVVGPLLQTEWGQGYGYNNYAPNYNCSTTLNGRVKAGCVATAMSQVIRYHESPYNWYNWSAMPNTSGNNAVSEIMIDAANVVGMNWGCSASRADEDDIAPALRNTFGYNNATQINYDGTNNYNDVQDDLDDGLPVIFSGYEKEHILGVPVRGEGHAWVADGYNAFTTCSSGGLSTSYLYFYMNWGWEGSYNGSYAFNNFNPGSSDYDYKSKVIINIEP